MHSPKKQVSPHKLSDPLRQLNVIPAKKKESKLIGVKQLGEDSQSHEQQRKDEHRNQLLNDKLDS